MRLIDADALIAEISNPKYPYTYDAEHVFKRMIDNAPTLLKVQEPRVMTLEEALSAEVNIDQCWLEVKGIKTVYLADATVSPEHLERASVQRWGASDCELPLDLYGEYWRMWTSRPTDEQREATPWAD